MKEKKEKRIKTLQIQPNLFLASCRYELVAGVY